MVRSRDLIVTARAEALFVSDLSADAQCSPDEVEAAICRAVRRHGGVRGCVAELAACYGQHPETAAPRMRWARETVSTLYAAKPRARRRLGLRETAARQPVSSGAVQAPGEGRHADGASEAAEAA